MARTLLPTLGTLLPTASEPVAVSAPAPARLLGHCPKIKVEVSEDNGLTDIAVDRLESILADWRPLNPDYHLCYPTWTRPSRTIAALMDALLVRGYECDFAPGSSIRDRVVSIAPYGALTRTTFRSSAAGKIARGSFYFRKGRWSFGEMVEVTRPIAFGAMRYYLDKYDRAAFTPLASGTRQAD